MANFQKWVLAIAIAVVFNIFINYGTNLFYTAPVYTDYCPNQGNSAYSILEKMGQTGLQQNNCITSTVSQEIQNNCSKQKGFIAYRYNESGCATQAYCETCDRDFSNVNEARNSNIFIILLIAGIIAVFFGLIVKADAVSTGLLLGGLVSLIIAAIRWGQLHNFAKLAIIGAVFIVLIWLGYKKGSK
jgi:hypothetical protein